MIEDEDDAPAAPPVRRRPLPANRKAIVGQLWRAARSQIEAHERRLADLPEGAAASEAEAKALSTLARTVRELVMLDNAAGQGGKPNDDLSPAEGLRHVAKLREELARRLEALAAAYLGEAAEAGAAPSGAGADGGAAGGVVAAGPGRPAT